MGENHAHEIEVYTDADMEQLLKDKAAISIDLPALGYTMREADIMGSLETGSMKVSATKIIYYLIHWGPVEVDKITPEVVSFIEYYDIPGNL